MDAYRAANKIESRWLLSSLFSDQYSHALVQIEDIILHNALHEWLGDLVMACEVSELQYKLVLVSLVCSGHIGCPCLIDRREAPIVGLAILEVHRALKCW